MKRKIDYKEPKINSFLITKDLQEDFFEERLKSSASDVMCKLCGEYDCICEQEEILQEEEC